MQSCSAVIFPPRSDDSMRARNAIASARASGRVPVSSCSTRATSARRCRRRKRDSREISGEPPCPCRRSVECGTVRPGSLRWVSGPPGYRPDHGSSRGFSENGPDTRGRRARSLQRQGTQPRRAVRFEKSGFRSAAFELRGEALPATTSERTCGPGRRGEGTAYTRHLPFRAPAGSWRSGRDRTHMEEDRDGDDEERQWRRR